MSGVAVRIHSLQVAYGDRIAVDDLSGEIHLGSVLVVLGPNGSGKSSLLRCLAGEIIGHGGEIQVLGHPAESLSPPERAARVAYVPQEESTPFPMTAREVVMMGRLCRATSLFDSEQDNRQVDQAMRATDTLSFADRFVQHLSAGERQRVLIARGLAQQPAVLLLDEPTSHLDLAHQIALRNLIERLRSDDLAIVVASHDLAWSFAIAESLWVMREGALVAQGTPDAIAAGNSLQAAYGVPVEMVRDRPNRWFSRID